MTWEWAFLISICVMCGTIVYLNQKPDNSESLMKITKVLDSVITEQESIKKDHASITKTAEETQKLLSQANLAMGFKPRTVK